MAKRFLISDTHFFHGNILKFTDKNGVKIRPFTTLTEMHETIVENWNKVVSPGDLVFHLGDVAWGNNFNILRRLNGNKQLILGNHDPHVKNLINFFSKIRLDRVFRDIGITLVHVPPHPSSLKTKFCVHGHTHNNDVGDPRYINVCVEKTNYSPVDLDEIVEQTRKIDF